MREKFERQLNQLKSELVHMGSMVEQAIEMAISALVTQDKIKANRTIVYSEEISKQQRDVENLCMKLLLSQQPVARDLRTVSSALKMVTDMDRIGVQAAEIAEISIYMSDSEYIKKLDHLSKMAKETTIMVIKALEAFVDNNQELAEEVVASDDTIDDLFVTVKNELIRLINEDANNGEQATDLLMVAKYFERIGDHAVNIAGWVIFSITGKQIEELN